MKGLRLFVVLGLIVGAVGCGPEEADDSMNDSQNSVSGRDIRENIDKDVESPAPQPSPANPAIGSEGRSHAGDDQQTVKGSEQPKKQRLFGRNIRQNVDK